MKKTIIAFTLMVFLLAGCGGTGSKPVAEEVKSEAPKEAQIVEEEPAVAEEEASSVQEDETVQEAETVEEDETEQEDETVQESDPVRDLLDRYMKDPNTKDFKYVMYDVNADGIEEVIFTDNQGRIAEIYGTRNGEPVATIASSDGLEITLYPKGMLKSQTVDGAEKSVTVWYQYFAELGDFLPVFEELNGEYYTYSAYDLSEDEIGQISSSIADTGDYPAWINEWGDKITQKEYDRIVPKDDPVALLEPDSLSDRDALDVIPEYLRYVNAPDGYANLRTGPGTEYEVICKVPQGDDLEVYRKEATSKSGKKWLKVTYLTEEDTAEYGYAWLNGWMADSQLE